MPEDQDPGTPQKPSEDVISDYYDDVKKLEMQGYEAGIKKARTTLFVTAALVLIGEVASVAVAGLEFTPFIIAFIAAEVGIFIGLAFWTKTKPFTAIIVGIIVFILLWIVGIIGTDGEAAYKGIIIKIAIIVYLSQALKPAKAWENLKKNG